MWIILKARLVHKNKHYLRRQMKTITFAQKIILKQIKEKEKWKEKFQDCFNNDTIIAYNESHGDYSEYC